MRLLGRYWLLMVAVACLGLYSYAYVERLANQAYESWEFDRTPERKAAAAISGGSVIPIGRARHVSRRGAPSSSITAIGRLTVPRLRLSAMVREGIDSGVLQLAVGHIPATALPGQAGNVGVAGHRDTFFRGLKDLRTGDEIHFATLAGDFTYVVESLSVVEPDNVGVLAATAGNVLTLVTCYPFSYIGDAPRRFIARAVQVSPQTAQPETVKR